MKALFGLVLSLCVVSSAFAQPAEILVFDQQPVEVQAAMVSDAKVELVNLQKSLTDARFKKVAALTIGITSATVSVISGLMATTTPSMVKSVSGGLKGTFTVIGVGFVAVSAGAGYGAYKSFQWYNAKSDEIDQLLKDLEKARIAVEAADRTFRGALLKDG